MNFENAKEEYAKIGVDVEKAISTAKEIPVSVHCWQGDDVAGFEDAGNALSGGIQVTGNYPGRARTIDELRDDISKALEMIPGKSRLNIHASYADFSETQKVDRDQIRPEHFKSWLDWAGSKNLKIDFNPTYFAHPKSADFTLTSPDEGIRQFWVEHGKRCREISAWFGKNQGSACVENIWIPDGMKDIPADREFFRNQLTKSLDEILSAQKFSTDEVKDSVESKVFGIGSESYVAGSHEFYLGYAIKNQILYTVDTGHFHTLENVSDKISSVLMYVPEILLHLSRGVRWDSDHVTILNDELISMASEIVKPGRTEKIHIGTDFFDGSINRIGAWATGVRAVRKALLFALLQPTEKMCQYEKEGKYFERLALMECAKTMPFGTIWDRLCEECNVPEEAKLISAVEEYEKNVTSKRM